MDSEFEEKNMIAKWVTRLFIVFFILLFSQLPVFVDQYEIRLQGHLAESMRQIEAFQTAAAAGGKTLDQYIEKFLEQPDADFTAQGKLMKEAVDRNRLLARATEALRTANPFLRPIVFIRYVDNQVLTDAWKSFTPGLSLTLNVCLWAGIGLIVGGCSLLALRSIWGWLTSQKKETPV
jgi:hypothetical protein